MNLDLGCGDKKVHGCVGVDVMGSPDVLWDLNNVPYPFDSESCERVYMNSSLEHLYDPVVVLSEVHRLLKKDGVLILVLPYWNHHDSVSSIEHRTFWDKKKVFSLKGFRVSSFEYEYDYRLKYIPSVVKRCFGWFCCNIISGMRVELVKI